MLRRAAIGLSLTLGLGGAIELMQLAEPHRVASLSDILRDISGSMIALFQVMFKAAKGNILRYWWMFCGFTILALNLFSFCQVMVDEVRASLQFPILADFESAGELGRWGNSRMLYRDNSIARTGTYSGRIELATTTYSGVALSYFPRNWKEQTQLTFSIFNPGDEIELNLRIHDRLHLLSNAYGDRYNKVFFLESGWNDIAVPLYDVANAPHGRQLDLGEVMAVGLFVVRQDEERILYLDSLRLE